MALLITPPPSFFNKSIRTQWKSFFSSLTGATIEAATGNVTSAAKHLAGIFTSFQFDKNKPGEAAWVWISCSLARAIGGLIDEQPDIIKRQVPADIDAIAEELARMMAAKEIRLKKAVFQRPKEQDFVRDFMEPFSRWLQKFGLPPSTAKSIAATLPKCLPKALDEEWQERHSEYESVKNALEEGPAAEAAREESAWGAYSKRLQEEIKEPILDESFGLAQIYVWPRAYYEEKIEPDLGKPDYRDHRQAEVKRTPFWLKDELLKWLTDTTPKNAIRVISGDPGSGKSSFTKMLAADLSGGDVSVIRVPLHLLDLEKPWADAVTTYMKNFEELEVDPFRPPKGQSTFLIIFDGLDEIVRAGKDAETLVTNFLSDVDNALRPDKQRGRVKALVTGRTYAIHSHKSSFREDQQILHLLPYSIDGVLPKESTENPDAAESLNDEVDQELKQWLHHEDDEKIAPMLKLLKVDQRDEWWQAYGALTGSNYSGCPEPLKEGVFCDLTRQPLLNHLVARVHREGRIDFSGKANPNRIYEEIVNSVYERPWGEGKNPIFPANEKEAFNRVLEEIGVCAWQGGRCANVKAIEERCEGHQFSKVREFLSARAKNPMKLLFTGFFFRDVTKTTGSESVEFTHKTFYEYLTARRIVRQIEITSSQMKTNREDPYYGWSPEQALKHWAELCWPAAMDQDLFAFILNEVELRRKDQVQQWQEDLRLLIEYMLTHGMPRPSVDKTITYKEADGMARNAEEALLAGISSCARLTNERYSIKWPEPTSAGDWICRLRGQRKETEVPTCFSLEIFNHINMSGQFLFGQDLLSADLHHADLREANLRFADLGHADLSEANLSFADLSFADLSYANLSHANLSHADPSFANLLRADLRHADLDSANLSAANLSSADLSHADLSKSNLYRTNLDAANLSSADLSHADLSEADLSEANLSYANLSYANLSSTDLTGANLRRTNLFSADFSKADLHSADLRGVNLRSANLTGAGLTGADVCAADLREANLTSADLRETNLHSANLFSADLTGADLREANLSETYLFSAKLIAADLSEANLSAADLEGADLSGAKLEGAKGLPDDLSPYMRPDDETDQDTQENE